MLKQIPFIIGIAKEYENLTIYGNEEKILTKAYLHYKDCMRPHKLDSVSPSNKKVICILYSYINRKPLDTTNYKNDLENVLSYSNLIVEFLEQLCYELNGYQHYKIINEFSQNLHQQISYINNPFNAFFQLPYFDNNKIQILKNKNKIKNYSDSHFSDFLKLDNKSIKDILSEIFNEEQIEDINKAIEAILTYDLNVSLINNYGDIIVGDTVDIEITIIRNNLEEGQKVGLTHSLGFTEIFDEKVSISTINNNKIKNSIKTISERENKIIVHFKANIPGKNKLLFELVSLNYKGINISKEFEIFIKEPSISRKIPKIVDDAFKKIVKKKKD